MTHSGLTTWRPARQRLAAIAVLMATLTGAGAATLGASGWHIFGAGAYVVATLAAIFSPAAIIVQVIGGQLLAASVVLGRDGSPTLLLLPVIASVVATAELLAIVARSAAALDRDPGDDVRRAGVTVSIAAVVFGVVAIIGRLPGPTGILAIVLAASACLVLAVLLVGDTR